MDELGKIKLFNADCMDIMRQYPDKYFELAVVDPPYGINAGKMTMGSGKHNYTKNKDWDESIPDNLYFTELFRVSKNQIIWGGNYFTQHLPPSKNWIVWDKLNPNLTFADGELAWVNIGNNLRIYKHYSAQVEDGGKIHPTQKPVKLYEWIYHNYANKGDKILDTHLGSGSSAIAAHNGGFDFTGIEIDTEYYNAAKKRIMERQRQLELFEP